MLSVTTSDDTAHGDLMKAMIRRSVDRQSPLTLEQFAAGAVTPRPCSASQRFVPRRCAAVGSRARPACRSHAEAAAKRCSAHASSSRVNADQCRSPTIRQAPRNWSYSRSSYRRGSTKSPFVALAARQVPQGLARSRKLREGEASPAAEGHFQESAAASVRSRRARRPMSAAHQLHGLAGASRAGSNIVEFARRLSRLASSRSRSRSAAALSLHAAERIERDVVLALQPALDGSSRSRRGGRNRGWRCGIVSR